MMIAIMTSHRLISEIDAHYFSVSSYSSEFVTLCNGMCCPSGRGCMFSINVVNGNRTSNTSCSNYNGNLNPAIFDKRRIIYAYINIFV